MFADVSQNVYDVPSISPSTPLKKCSRSVSLKPVRKPQPLTQSVRFPSQYVLVTFQEVLIKKLLCSQHLVGNAENRKWYKTESLSSKVWHLIVMYTVSFFSESSIFKKLQWLQVGQWLICYSVHDSALNPFSPNRIPKVFHVYSFINFSSL